MKIEYFLIPVEKQTQNGLKIKCKSKDHKNIQETIVRMLFDINHNNMFLDLTQGKENKSKNKQMT